MNFNLFFSSTYGTRLQNGIFISEMENEYVLFNFEMSFSDNSDYRLEMFFYILSLSNLNTFLIKNDNIVNHDFVYGGNIRVMENFMGTPLIAADDAVLAENTIQSFLSANIAHYRVSSMQELQVKLFHLVRYVEVYDVDESHMIIYRMPLIRDKVMKVDSWEIVKAIVEEKEVDYKNLSWERDDKRAVTFSVLVHFSNGDQELVEITFTSLSYFMSFYEERQGIFLTTPHHIIYEYSFSYVEEVFEIIFRDLRASSTQEALLKLALYFKVPQLEELLSTPMGEEVYTLGEVKYEVKKRH